MVQPDSFIDVAEETGLLVTMDEQVMARSCRQVARWRSDLGSAATASA